jgi:hypothetical protein
MSYRLTGRDPRVVGLVWATALLFLPAQSMAQVTWRARVIDEVTASKPNDASPFRPHDAATTWSVGNRFIASSDGSVDMTSAIRAGWSGVFDVLSDDSLRARAREAYLRVAPVAWLDLEAGKRLTRWGTGYAFTPTGVLDPPRDASDPTDRLGVQEGILHVRADVFRGATVLTVAAAAPRVYRPHLSTTANRLIAARVRTTVAGVELAAIAAAAEGQPISFGGNFTHVIGQQLEYHGELLVHADTSSWRSALAPEAARERRISGVAGFQYTFRRGINIIAEYFRDGSGLDGAMWRRLFAGTGRSRDATGGPLQRPNRQNFVFVRASRANINARIVPELITLGGLDDGSLTVVAGVTVSISSHLQVCGRSTSLTGPSQSADGSAPLAHLMVIGASARF